jgi:serine/arginine repetitive matrix protein 2
MSSSRYSDNNRYGRDRSPYRDRRQSTYSSGYAPRANDLNPRPTLEASGFPPREIPREIPRGPKSLGDAPRVPATTAPSGAPSAPRDGRGRGFAGRGEVTSLRDAPPLSSVAHSHPHNSWRADRDRDRDFERDRRDRRPSPPPRRSPIRDVRDNRDVRDFPPRDLDINRARRNSRDGPPSAGSTYSDPPLVTGSSYRGSGIGRGRGGRDFHGDPRGRGRTFHNDDRDRHHDARDRMPDRSYRPRSRSRESVRRDRDPRDERDFERRDRDERRFVPREYDSYIGPAGSLKSGPRGLDTHRGSVVLDSRHPPGTPTGVAPHPTHHSPADRLGPSLDSYSRRSSTAAESLAAKDGRREPGGNDLLLAGRAEASRERYAPRASSPPAAVPAFGFSSNVWRNPALDTKSVTAPQPPKPTIAVPPPTTSAAVPTTPIAPVASKASIPAGLTVAPPTGPKADRAPERLNGDAQVTANTQDNRLAPVDLTRIETRPSLASGPQTNHGPGPESIEPKQSIPAPSVASAPANSPPQGPAPRPRVPPTGPQAALRANVSPSFPRPAHLPYAPRDMSRDASPGAIPPPMGSRSGSGSGSVLSINTSPKTLPANIPTGPKADRANTMAARPSSMFPPLDRSGFQPPRMPMGGAPKSMQWVRPGLNLNNRTIVPTKREFPAEDRERSFSTPSKAPKFDNSMSATDFQRPEHGKPVSPSLPRSALEHEPSQDQGPPGESHKVISPKPSSIKTRRFSDVTMADPCPPPEKPPVSATSSAPEALEDSDEDLDLDDADFAESEAKYNREKALLESKRIDLSASSLRATTPLQEIMLLASLTIEHLPCQESKSVEEEVASMPLIQLEPESITTELPTPKDEETGDVIMDGKDEKQVAPATRALRLRHGTSDNHEETPDLSSLPYLGSAPLTPISELEVPSVSESVMVAIRDRLRKTIEPESDPEGTLEDFAIAYRRWRLYIQSLDDTKDVVEQERQPSAEPSLKGTTPDVQSSAMGPLLDLPPPTTSRRGHSSRWATEYDLEAALKESLKTAEEESKGKKEREPTRSMADPEKEAEVPPELTAYEAQRRRYIDTNFQREPGQGIFAFHYEPPEDDFTECEHRIMVQHYKDQYAKKWGKLAEALYKEAGTSRTYKDCINHYYATKWRKEYKGKVKGRRGGHRRRGGGAGRGRGAIANMERPDVSGEDGLPPALTETGRPRRSAAPTFGAETDLDTTTSTPTPGRIRRGTDADGNQEKVGRRGKLAKEKGGRKAKVPPLAAAPIGSPVKLDHKVLGVKMEDEAGKRPLAEMPFPMHLGIPEDQLNVASESQFHPGLAASLLERPKLQPAVRPGPSSYWSVTEQTDFQRNVAYFGTDFAAIATHMGTKTQTMVKNQFMRLVESGQAPELRRAANEADQKRDRGEDPGPPPTPTPAPKRRYESTQVTAPRTLAPTPEATISHSVALPKASPPNVPSSSRFSNIAQAPQQGKLPISTTGYGIPDPSLASVPSLPPQQSPQALPPRSQSQQHLQHHPSQPEMHHRGPGPRSGFFSQNDFPPRREHRQPSQASNVSQISRPLQPQAPPQLRAHEQPDSSLFRSSGLQDREALPRTEPHQEHDAQLRYQPQDTRRISGELHGRLFSSVASSIPQMRSGPRAGSPENPLSLQHRHVQQPQPSLQTQTDASAQPANLLPSVQPLPAHSTVATPPVKDEPRHYPHSHSQQPQHHAQMPTHSQAYPLINHTSAQAAPTAPTAPTAPAPKPATEPRKSNLLSLLNDTEPEEPRRKKPTEQNAPSHTPTPQQQTSIAPPPPVSQALPPRRDPYNDPATSQAPFGRPSYAQQSALPQITSNRQAVDLTNEQTAGGRGPQRESWQRQPYPGQNQSQQGPSHNSPHVGLAQPAFSDSRMFGNHRSVFAQHNGPRHNPSPPPHPAYNNSPHLHSRTPSLGGAGSQQSRHGLSTSAVGQHPQPPNATSQILQPNPYAQVDPPGNGPQPSGPVGMRPSPHLHTSHIGSQREVHGRNDQSQVHNGGLAYPTSQTPNEHHPGNHHIRGHSIQEQYRSRDPRDIRPEFDARNAERDMSHEVSRQANALLREQRDSLLSRSTGPSQSHQDVRYQPPPQDRGYTSQRSHTPLSRSDHGPAPPLQHPPHSSLGEGHPLYGGQRQEEHTHRLRDPFPRDSRMDRMREEHVQQQQQQQQHAAMSREEYIGREREMREREMREMRDRELSQRDAQYRENLIRRGQAPPPPHGQQQEQRGSVGVPPDWANAVRPPPERWQR